MAYPKIDQKLYIELYVGLTTDPEATINAFNAAMSAAIPRLTKDGKTELLEGLDRALSQDLKFEI